MIDVTNLPPPLRGIESGTFTEKTFRKRLPDIARRTAQGAHLSLEARHRLTALADEVPFGILRPLRDDGAPDTAQWLEWMKPFMGIKWLEAPWFPAETYFFRRILEATGYFQAGPDKGVDPFYPQKCDGLDMLGAQIGVVYDRLQSKNGDLEQNLTWLLHTVIWGNQADLSIWPMGSKPPASHSGEDIAAHLLVDQACAAAKFLMGKSENHVRVDFLLDNVGLELAYDLVVADFLLANQLAAEVRFHAKPWPTYVSDVTIPDVWDMVDYLKQAPDGQAIELGERLWAHLKDQRLKLFSDLFWISPLLGWEMPKPLWVELSKSELIISKGDANYRRWLGDRHWPFVQPISEILSYRPAPLLLMRVLKSEVVAGLQVGQAEEMFQKDKTWLYNGSYAVIQLVE